MEKFEMKKLGVKSVFKVSIYFMIVPMILFILFGMLMGLIGVLIGEYELLMVGLVYTFIFIFIIPFNAVIYMLLALIYNFLSSKFGGLEIVLDKKEELN